MSSGLKEIAGLVATLGGLVGVPLAVLGYQNSLNPIDRRLIQLTGVMKDGAWTAETVTALNYGLEHFESANVRVAEGEKVLFRLTSADVTHGFYVPELGIGPLEVEPGHVVEVPFDAPERPGVFTYYCTMVCGECHHFMRGTIQIGDVANTETKTLPLRDLCQHHLDPTQSSSLTGRGELLFASKGCVACHGDGGEGGVRNPNYAKDTVPDLVTLAERMYLYDSEDVAAVVRLMEQDVDLESVEEDPPFRRYNRFLAQYQSVRGVIRNGNRAAAKDTLSFSPPLQMPAWEAELTDRDIDALIAYLIAQYPWDEEF